MATSPNEAEVGELRERPYQRRFFSLPDRSVVTVWADKRGAINLTVTKSGSTLPIAVAEEKGVGD